MTNRAFVVDRIVGGTAICECLETGEKIELDAKKRPPNCREGDILRTTNDGCVVDIEATRKRKEQLSERLNRLFTR